MSEMGNSSEELEMQPVPLAPANLEWSSAGNRVPNKAGQLRASSPRRHSAICMQVDLPCHWLQSADPCVVVSETAGDLAPWLAVRRGWPAFILSPCADRLSIFEMFSFSLVAFHRESANDVHRRSATPESPGRQEPDHFETSRARNSRYRRRPSRDILKP